jgi:short-subunit dehydrogenase
MKQRKSGSIISVASIAGMQSLPYMATYSGTKAFNLFQAMSLWYELKNFNVHVMTLCPGPVKTEFGDVAKVPGSPSGATKLTADYVAKNTIQDLEKKKMISIPSKKMKLIAILIKFLPRRLVTIIIGYMLSRVINRNH